MNKEALKGLLEVIKSTSAKDLWDLMKDLEEKLELTEDAYENLEDYIVSRLAEEADEEEAGEEEKSFEQLNTVAKAKGLPEIEGNLVKKFYGLTMSSNLSAGQAETKGVRNKKKASDYLPSDEELEKINKLSNVDLNKEDVFVFTLSSADTEIDRSHDQFSTKALRDMAEMSVDKPFLRDHSWNTANVIGKIFDAKVSDKKLVQKVYVPNIAKNQDMIQGMMNGTHNKVSVGFAMNPMDYVCSSCSKSLYSMDCSHYPGGKDSKGQEVIAMIRGVKDYFEISNVPVPAQRGAGIRRNTEKSLDVTEETVSKSHIDRISNEILSNCGDNPVPEEIQETPEVVETKAVEAEVPAAPEEVVETKAVEAEKDTEVLKAIASAFESAIAPVVSELKAVVAELNASLEAKKAVEKTAQEESTEEIARKLALTSVAKETGANSKPDFSKSGWGLSLIDAFKTNQ